jgi:predicted  nucleic acid-binding Zn-ribbon protein
MSEAVITIVYSVTVLIAWIALLVYIERLSRKIRSLTKYIEEIGEKLVNINDYLHVVDKTVDTLRKEAKHLEMDLDRLGEKLGVIKIKTDKHDLNE